MHMAGGKYGGVGRSRTANENTAQGPVYLFARLSFHVSRSDLYSASWCRLPRRLRCPAGSAHQYFIGAKCGQLSATAAHAVRYRLVDYHQTGLIHRPLESWPPLFPPGRVAPGRAGVLFAQPSLGGVDCWRDTAALTNHPRDLADGPRTLTAAQDAYRTRGSPMF